MTAHIHWAVRNHLPAILKIEAQSFTEPWDQTAFITFLRERLSICLVAEIEGQPVGYVAYMLLPGRLEICRLAVDPDFRRQYIGHQLVRKVCRKVENNPKRKRVELLVNEGNLTAQLFFKAQGFRATATVRKPYERYDEDAYRMEWRADGTETEQITQADLDRLFYGGVKNERD